MFCKLVPELNTLFLELNLPVSVPPITYEHLILPSSPLLSSRYVPNSLRLCLIAKIKSKMGDLYFFPNHFNVSSSVVVLIVPLLYFGGKPKSTYNNSFNCLGDITFICLPTASSIFFCNFSVSSTYHLCASTLTSWSVFTPLICISTRIGMRGCTNL